MKTKSIPWYLKIMLISITLINISVVRASITKQGSQEEIQLTFYQEDGGEWNDGKITKGLLYPFVAFKTEDGIIVQSNDSDNSLYISIINDITSEIIFYREYLSQTNYINLNSIPTGRYELRIVLSTGEYALGYFEILN